MPEGLEHPLVQANAKELLRFLSYSVFNAHLIMTKRFIYAVSCYGRAFFCLYRMFLSILVDGIDLIGASCHNLIFVALSLI